MSFREARLVADGVAHEARLLELENAVLFFFYAGGMRIGTLAFAMPALVEGTGITSSVLLGSRHLYATRALAERVAAAYRKMSLASVNTELPEREALRVAVQLFEQILAQSSGVK